MKKGFPRIYFFTLSTCRNFAPVFVRNAQKQGLLFTKMHNVRIFVKMQILFTF